jgi:hypothetical protein
MLINHAAVIAYMDPLKQARPAARNAQRKHKKPAVLDVLDVR